MTHTTHTYTHTHSHSHSHTFTHTHTHTHSHTFTLYWGSCLKILVVIKEVPLLSYQRSTLLWKERIVLWSIYSRMWNERYQFWQECFAPIRNKVSLSEFCQSGPCHLQHHTEFFRWLIQHIFFYNYRAYLWCLLLCICSLLILAESLSVTKCTDAKTSESSEQQ